MSNSEESVFILKCLQFIEGKLEWGKSSEWTNYDFEKLSDNIAEKTSVRLSITTLKRIWGKIKYENAPTTATLNTLAQFADFEDWRSFRLSVTEKRPVAIEETFAQPIPAKKKVSPKFWFYSLAIGCFGAGIAYFILGSIASIKRPDPNDFSFMANKIVSRGVPNSVIFTYNAKAAQTDSVFIVQTWDIRRKTLVSKNATHHSAIYYYPGYFRTRLIVDGETVKRRSLQITSNGWLGLIEREDKPFYFDMKDVIKDSVVDINEALLTKNNFSLKPEPPKIRIFNQGDLGDLMNDNFTFETTLKNGYKEGNNVCQFVEVLIQCKDDIIIIPLCAKACVGEIKLYAAGKELESKVNDLSGFGADLSQWTNLKVVTQNKLMTIFVNGRKASSLTFPNDPTGIVGVQYRFPGVGSVKNTWFENHSGRRNL